MTQIFRKHLVAIVLTIVISSLWPVWAILIAALIQWGAGL